MESILTALATDNMQQGMSFQTSMNRLFFNTFIKVSFRLLKLTFLETFSTVVDR